MIQGIVRFFTWIVALFTVFVLRLVIQQQREMILTGMYEHPRYEKLKQSRTTLLDDLDHWGYVYRHGKLRRKQ